MSRMFMIDGKPMTTWNVFVGCRYECTFCNAKKAAETRFKHIPRYRDGFTPKFIEKELRRRFKPGEFVFIAYMGDIAWAKFETVLIILDIVWLYPETSFLFLTKNPGCYWVWKDKGLRLLPPNLYLGGTIETNLDYSMSKAPIPYDRYVALASFPWPKKFVSVEPIMDFHLDTLVDWMKEIKPEIIEMGADNYHNHLPEPPWWKVEQLLTSLRSFCPSVVEKEGLERLKRRGHEVVSLR